MDDDVGNDDDGDDDGDDDYDDGGGDVGDGHDHVQITPHIFSLCFQANSFFRWLTVRMANTWLRELSKASSTSSTSPRANSFTPSKATLCPSDRSALLQVCDGEGHAMPIRSLCFTPGM